MTATATPTQFRSGERGAGKKWLNENEVVGCIAGDLTVIYDWQPMLGAYKMAHTFGQRKKLGSDFREYPNATHQTMRAIGKAAVASGLLDTSYRESKSLKGLSYRGYHTDFNSWCWQIGVWVPEGKGSGAKNQIGMVLLFDNGDVWIAKGDDPSSTTWRLAEFDITEHDPDFFNDAVGRED